MLSSGDSYGPWGIKKKRDGFSCFLSQSYDLISSEVRAFNRVTVASCVGKIGEIFKGALTKEKREAHWEQFSNAKGIIPLS